VGDRGGGPASAPGKGKPVRVILDDDKVSSDEDEPLQKQLWQLSSAGTAMLNMAATMTATADKEAVAKRVTEEAMVKVAVDEEVASMATDEAAGVVRDSPAPSQAPLVARAKRAAAPSGSTPPANHPYRGVWKPQFVHTLSSLLFLYNGASFSDYISLFLPSSPSGAATATGMTAFAVGTAAADAAVWVTCHTPVLKSRTEASIRVPRMFKSHV
jgi:hypothetical protein